MQAVDGEDDVNAIDVLSSADLDRLNLLFAEDPAGVYDEGITGVRV
jgi:hypothetical protein